MNPIKNALRRIQKYLARKILLGQAERMIAQAKARALNKLLAARHCDEDRAPKGKAAELERSALVERHHACELAHLFGLPDPFTHPPLKPRPQQSKSMCHLLALLAAYSLLGPFPQCVIANQRDDFQSIPSQAMHLGKQGRATILLISGLEKPSLPQPSGKNRPLSTNLHPFKQGSLAYLQQEGPQFIPWSK